MTRLFPDVEPPLKKPRTDATSESAKEAVEMAVAYARATTPAQRANVERFFSKPENKQHASLLIAAQKLPRGVSLSERESLLRQRLQRFR